MSRHSRQAAGEDAASAVLARRALHANAFRDALREAGVPAQIVDASDRTHGEINQWFGDPKDEKVTARSVAFPREVLARQ